MLASSNTQTSPMFPKQKNYLHIVAVERAGWKSLSTVFQIFSNLFYSAVVVACFVFSILWKYYSPAAYFLQWHYFIL